MLWQARACGLGRELHLTQEEKCASTEGMRKHVNLKHTQVELKHSGPWVFLCVCILRVSGYTRVSILY